MTMLSDNMRGALFMMLGMMGFVFNDMLIKVVSSDLNLFQTIFVRGIITTALIGTFAWYKGVLLHSHAKPSLMLFLRIAGEIGGTFCFLTALFHIPLADATAIIMAMPLVVTLGAALFLGEHVGWRRYSAIALGFIGVIIILRPSAEGIDTYYLFALATVFFMVTRDLCTRKLHKEVPSLFVALMSSAAITIASGLMTPFEEWRPVSTESLGILVGAALCIFVGYIFTVMTVRTGDISFSAPFRYTNLVWAIILGILVFDHIPDPAVLIGGTIVVATGLYSLLRERALNRRAQKA